MLHMHLSCEQRTLIYLLSVLLVAEWLLFFFLMTLHVGSHAQLLSATRGKNHPGVETPTNLDLNQALISVRL